MHRKISGASSRVLQKGFTVVELSVVVIILSILATIVIVAIGDYQVQARDGQRTADNEVIVRSLERHYRTQAIAVGASYPATTAGAAGIATIVDQPDAVIAPEQATNSVVIATTNAAQTPTVSQYIYQPLNLNGSLCTATPCVRFKMYYRLEQTNTVVTRESMRQQ